MIGYNLRRAMEREHFEIKPIDNETKYEGGKKYWCGYWSQTYEVEKVNYEDNDLKGVLVLWDGGSEYTNTITSVQKDNLIVSEEDRRLTPRECWRLFDFTDSDYDKVASANSDTQLYKQAGNSIIDESYGICAEDVR